MTGQAHWLTLAVVVGGGILIFVIAFFATRLDQRHGNPRRGKVVT